MDVEQLTDAARVQTGLDDFGSDSYREGLGIYVDALDEEAQLSELGAAALEAQLTGNLVNRLRVTAWIADHPELLEERVERPIIVLGLPRTGTTLLSELLHRDPGNRSLMRWEAQDCVPPPDAATFTTDPRIDAARESMGMMDALNPGFAAIHYEAPDGPTECVSLLAQDFKSLLWETIANVPSYGEWLLACDETSAYEYHHLVLRLLQSRAPGRWALKTPHHCLDLDALVTQYPDARLVMTHRDPVTVVSSLTSLVRSLSGTFSEADRGDYINERWTTVAGAIVDRVMSWRDEHGDAAFVDVPYDELLADPVAEVQRIYGHFDEEVPPAAVTAMATYVADHPQGTHGRHRYTPAELGLDVGALEERFAPYRARFAIPHDGID